MTTGAKIALVTEVPGGSGRDLVWAWAEQQGNRRPIDLHGAVPRRAVLVRATAEARSTLREAASAVMAAAVRARSVAEVLDEALAVLADAGSSASGSKPADDTWSAPGALSPREREVLALVAEGRSNKAIAEALSLSPNTIKTHVASLLHKLDADSRAQLAAMVAGQAFRQR